MKKTLAGLAFATIASAAIAQTATDDSTSTENWWDRVGAAFFSDEGLTTMRPEADIRAQWTGLSADDQAALRARCDAIAGMGDGTAASTQDATADTSTTGTTATDTSTSTDTATGTGATAGTETGTAAETTVTGSEGGTENQVASDAGTSTESGMTDGAVNVSDTQLIPVCDLVKSL
jgi:hypothetical protein